MIDEVMKQGVTESVSEVGVLKPEIGEAKPYNAAEDPLHPYGKACSICSSEYDDDEWGIMGWLGILPVSFCVNCMTGIYNMVFQMTSVEELQSVIEEKQAEEKFVPPSPPTEE
jgi:hypothetical protein